MSHTPGPWRRYKDKTGRVSKIEGRGRRVCTFQPSDLNAEANASLIAAAPDLLEALEWYAEKVTNCRKITREGDKARDDLDYDGGRRARIALEKARGEK